MIKSDGNIYTWEIKDLIINKNEKYLDSITNCDKYEIVIGIYADIQDES